MTRSFHLPFFAFALLISSINLNAQGFPYLLSIDEQPFVEIEGIDLIEDSWDDPEFIVPLGFDFEFFGDTISELYQIGLGSMLTGSLDYYSDNPNILMPYGSDIIDLGYDFDPISKISHITEGTPGDQICKIEWKDVGFYEDFSNGNPTPSSLSFQTWIYESNGTIEIRFGPNFINLPDSLIHDFGGDPVVGFFENFDFNSYNIENFWYLAGNEDSPKVANLSNIDEYALLELDALNANPTDGRVYRFSKSPFVSNTEEPQLQNLVRIYPSPAKDFTLVNIKQQNFDHGRIQLINQLGQLISQQIAYAGKQQVDLSAVPNGAYFIHIQIDENQYSEMIIKQ